ncbi:MAG: hypothetical protein JWQ28_2710 [Pedobacter sp.]|jgi:hypothetical protein|nr:hypothetical protein [Pedobacter sp.]
MAENPYRKDVVQQPGMGWIKNIAYLLDEQFRLPGTNFRFGLDPIINLVPVLGDIPGFLISAGLLLAMARKGASNKVVVLMGINILLDTVIGGIPLIGQLFDFFFKSNTRNLKLMREHYLEGKHQGSGKGTILIAVIVMLIVLVLLVLGLIKLSGWIVGWFS